jgi:hypothetical protein
MVTLFNLVDDVNPYFYDDLEGFLHERGQAKVEDMFKSARLTAYRERVYFVHGLDNHNSCATPTRAFDDFHKSPEDRLAYLLTIQPAICVSHVRGDIKIWSSAGVIIKDGDIVAAGCFGTNREQRNRMKKNNVRLREIAEVCSRASGDLSELVIKKPTPAGLYLSIIETTEGLQVDRRDGYYQQYKAFAEKWNLPLYALFHGELYEFTEQKNRRVELGRRLTREEVLERKIELNQDRVRKEQERVLTTPGFVNGKYTEFQMFDSWKKGVDLFLQVQEVQAWNALGPAEQRIYGKPDRYDYFFPRSSYNEFTGIIDDQRTELMPYGFVELDVGLTSFGFYRPFSSSQDIVVAMEQVAARLDFILQVAEKRDKELTWREGLVFSLQTAPTSLFDYVVVPYHQSVERTQHIGASLYGFAEEAIKNGEVRLGERMRTLAQKYLSRDAMQALLDKRLAPNGNFRTYLHEVQFA